MRRLLVALVVAALASTAAAQEAVSPHAMTNADGSLDMAKCAPCHTPNLGLTLPKREICTLCHLETTHGGSQAHLRAAPERVRAAMAGAPESAPALKLREDGGIFCGTCHLYHDPKVLGERELASGWIPPDRGLPGAIRADVTGRWTRLAEGTDHEGPLGRFATRGTRRLWLPVEDGTLCLTCHGGLR